MTSQLRARLYLVFKWIGIALGSAEAGVLAAGRHWMPLTVALAVYGFLSARVHSVARDHTPKQV